MMKLIRKIIDKAIFSGRGYSPLNNMMSKRRLCHKSSNVAIVDMFST